MDTTRKSGWATREMVTKKKLCYSALLGIYHYYRYLRLRNWTAGKWIEDRPSIKVRLALKSYLKGRLAKILLNSYLSFHCGGQSFEIFAIMGPVL